MSDTKPIHIDARFKWIFERRLLRNLREPDLFVVVPRDRYYLLYGQKGSGMRKCIEELLRVNKVAPVNYKFLECTSDSAEMKAAFDRLLKQPGFPILVLLNAHLLLFHRELYPIILNLKKRLENVGYVIATSERVPKDDEKPFWDQFHEDLRCVMSTPGPDFHRRLLKYYFDTWNKEWTEVTNKLLIDSSGSGPASPPIDVNLDQLVTCCDDATPRDIRLFCMRIFNAIRDNWPEKPLHVTMDLLMDMNNGFMFPMKGVMGTSLYQSITDRDCTAAQNEFDTRRLKDALPVEKRMKFDDEKVIEDATKF